MKISDYVKDKYSITIRIQGTADSARCSRLFKVDDFSIKEYYKVLENGNCFRVKNTNFTKNKAIITPIPTPAPIPIILVLPTVLKSLLFYLTWIEIIKLKLRIFSIPSKPNQDNIRKNHVVLGMEKLAVIRRDSQELVCQK